MTMDVFDSGERPATPLEEFKRKESNTVNKKERLL